MIGMGDPSSACEWMFCAIPACASLSMALVKSYSCIASRTRTHSLSDRNVASPGRVVVAGASLEAGNGIVIDAKLQTSAPSVFAAGDVASA